MLLDYLGRPIEKELLTREIAAPTLVGIRTIWTNQIASGLTPDKLARILRAAADGDHDDYLTLAEEMEERNSHYAAELAKRKLAVSRLPLTVEAASDNKTDQELADAVRDLIRRPGIKTLIKNLLDGIAKGFSAVEIIWDRSGSRWIPNYKWRDGRFFLWDMVSKSELRLRDEANAMEGILLAPYKFIVHMPIIKTGIPIRGGLAFPAAWDFMCSGYNTKDWLAFAEVFGMPLRLGKYRPGADKDDIAVLKIAVANLGSDGAAVFPDSMMIELVEAAKSGSNDFFKILSECLENRISKLILGQTASSGGTPGKLGEEKLQSEVREDIRDDDAEQIAETLNRDLVRAFIDLNYGPQKNYPIVCLRAVKQEDIKTLSEALDKLVPLGLRVEQSVIRDKMGLPDPPEGAECLTAPESTQPQDKKTPATKQATTRETHACAHCGKALNQEAADDADAVDSLVDESLDDWEPVIKPLMTPVVDLVNELIQSGGTLQDLLQRLSDLYPDQNDERFIADLAQAMLQARAMGDVMDEV